MERARSRLPGREDAARLTSVLSLLTDPTPACVLYALDVVEELCAGNLAVPLDLGEGSVSYALRLLRTAGVVTAKKEGRVVYYRLADGFSAPLREHCLRRLINLSQSAETSD